MRYVYAARNEEGRLLHGLLHAEHRRQALDHLRARSLFVTALDEHRAPRGFVRASLLVGRIDQRSLVSFYRTFATMIEAGVPLRRAIDVSMERCSSQRLREALASIGNDVEGGIPLSVAMERRACEFPRLYTMMVRAAEVAGMLDAVLERIADLVERDYALRLRIYVALTYPAIVATTAISLVLFLVANTMPAFASMFAQMHVSLPTSTRIFLALGEALRMPSVWVGVSVCLIGAFLCVSVLLSKANSRELLDRWILRVPVVGGLIAKTTVERFTRILGSMIGSGISLSSALSAAGDVIGNRHFATRSILIGRAIAEGRSIATAMEEQQLFDPIVLQLVRVGEESGALDRMLLRLASYYELEVERLVASLSSALEPALIMIVGAIVATLVSSIVIPLYSLIGSIK